MTLACSQSLFPVFVPSLYSQQMQYGRHSDRFFMCLDKQLLFGDRLMKIGKTLLLILSCTYFSVSFAQSDSAVPGIQQRITSAHEEFQQVLVNAPEKEVEANV